MKALGKHILLELENCNVKLLDDLKQIEILMLEAAKKAKATIIESHFHRFSPFGVSGVVVIAESHLTIHTWPEHAYAAVDIFTCGKALQPKLATEYLIKGFASKKSTLVEFDRGIFYQKRGHHKVMLLPRKGIFLSALLDDLVSKLGIWVF